MFILFSKRKTAYEWRISDWSSDVCSSDLAARSSASVAITSWRSSGALCGGGLPGIRLLRDDIESLSGANAPWRCVRFGLDGLVPPSLARYHFQDRKSTRLNSSH